MIKSMTGFGRAESPLGEGRCVVEMKSVNHRYMDVSVQLPPALRSLEGRVKRSLQERFSRGRFDVYVAVTGGNAAPREVRVDLSLAKGYTEALRRLKEALSLPGEVTVEMVGRLKDIFNIGEEEPDAEDLWPAVESTIKSCMDKVDEMREKEGYSTLKDIRLRLEDVNRALDELGSYLPALNDLLRERLNKKLSDLFGTPNLDRSRLEQEVVYYVERSDVSEEMARLGNHLKEFGRGLEEDGPQGRRLDFLLQEINREVNTISSKVGDAFAAQTVVSMKTEIEKIRQQIQNIE